MDCKEVSLGIIKCVCANVKDLKKVWTNLKLKLLTKIQDFLTEWLKKKVLQKQHLKYIENNY